MPPKRQRGKSGPAPQFLRPNVSNSPGIRAFQERNRGVAPPVPQPLPDVETLNQPVNPAVARADQLKWIEGLEYAPPVGISHYIKSGQEILRTSTIAITKTSTNPRDPGGVNDLNMGCSLIERLNCAKCGKLDDCTGHTGYIPLPIQMVDPPFAKPTANIIQCTCPHCGYIPISKTSYEYLPKNSTTPVRARVINECCKYIHKCVNCDQRPLNIKVHLQATEDYGGAIIYSMIPPPGAEAGLRDRYKNTKYVMSIRRVYALLELSTQAMEKPTDKTRSAATFFGFPKPTSFVIDYIPVSPPTIRPPIITARGSIMQHSDTAIYREIIAAVDLLREAMKSSEDIRPEFSADNLYYKLVALIRRVKLGNSQSTNSARSAATIARKYMDVQMKIADDPDDIGELPDDARTTKITLTINVKSGEARNASVAGTMSGKPGRFKSTVARLTVGARATITSGPELRFGEIGVPYEIADKFSVRMTVTATNLAAIYYLTRPTKHFPRGRILEIRRKGAANFVQYQPGTPIEIDMDVKRTLMDGDLIAVNRFPIIHEASLMVFSIRFVEGVSFKVSEHVLRAFNADFDGDTMTSHFPQSDDAIEAFRRAHARLNLVSAADSKAVAGIIMDSALAAYLLSYQETELSEEVFQEYVEKVFGPNEDDIEAVMVDIRDRVAYINEYVLPEGMNKILTYSTRTLFSTLLREGLVLFESTDDSSITIINGVIIGGALTKEFVDNENHSLVRAVQNQFGNVAAGDLLTYSTVLGMVWLQRHAITLGFDDVKISDKSYRDEVDRIIRSTNEQYYIYMQKAIDERQGRGVGVDEKVFSKAIAIFKAAQGKFANVFMDYCKRTSVSGADSNALLHFIRSGNFAPDIVAQMTAVVGMMAFPGKACPETESLGFGENDVCQPYFQSTSYGHRRTANQIPTPADVGNVSNSYTLGINPQEILLAARAAMYGIVATNCLVSQQGHLFNTLLWILTGIESRGGLFTQVIGAYVKIIMFEYNSGLDPHRSVVNKLGKRGNYYGPVNVRDQAIAALWNGKLIQ